MPVPREWHHEIELGAVLDLGTDGHRPSDEAGPLLDADEAEAAAVACLRYREPAAIVGDAQLDGGAWVTRYRHSATSAGTTPAPASAWKTTFGPCVLSTS